MNLTQNDPLRFLKPRKKQFHLTPTKHHPKDNDTSELNISKQASFKNNNSKTQKNESFEHSAMVEQTNLTFMRKDEQRVNNQKKQQIKNPPKGEYYKDPIKNYDALKYFSSNVEEFLTKSSQSHQIKATVINKKPNYVEQSSIGDESNQADYIQTKNESHTRTDQSYPNLNILSKHSHSSGVAKIDKKPVIQTNLVEPKTSKPQALPKDKVLNKVNYQPSYENNQREEPEEEMEQGNNQGQVLKQCEICSRSFNPGSYEKHIKVCEKVFFKKRKQFSSQKQRSKSKKK